jgi:hypothetical protein
MSTPPPIPRTHFVRGRPLKVTLETLYEYMESLEKRREERDSKLQVELESLEKMSEKISPRRRG